MGASVLNPVRAKPNALINRFRAPLQGMPFMPALRAYSGLRPREAISQTARTLGRLGSLEVRLARSAADVRRAQKLRYRVFYKEMCAVPDAGKMIAQRDVDAFDAFCDHVIVLDHASRGPTGKPAIVGTYRLLRQQFAERTGGFYSAGEFDIAPLLAGHREIKFLELGRSCVHRDYRSGSVIMALWGGLGEYLQRWGIESMLGCASVPMSDGGHYAASLHRLFSERFLAPIEYHAFPRLPLPVEDLNQGLEVEPPALIKGYLRLGARICGQPAWDPDFNVADFLTLLRVGDMNPRYARHFLGLNRA